MKSLIEQTYRDFGHSTLVITIAVESEQPMTAEQMARFAILAEAAERYLAAEGRQG